MNTKVSSTIATRFNIGVLVLSSAILVSATFLPSLSQIVQADSYQDQINTLQAENAQSSNVVNDLQAQAASYQDAITKLQDQIDGLQASINDNVAQQASLQDQIVAAQAQIDHERAVLASDVKAMYVDGTPTTLEVLATSKNLSEFVDKQEYRTTVQNKLQDTLKKIADLQKQLQTQKARVDQLLSEQQAQQQQLAGVQAEQANLLNYNQGQQATYNSQIQANNSKVAQLHSAQVAANRQLSGGGLTAGDPGRGGYPAVYDNAAQDSILDRWGMYNRECVSYTAWKVQQTYGHMPYGLGDAKQWPSSARAVGYNTGSTPRANTVAIWNVGYYGHAMWVEAVNGDGSIWVSQYNYDYAGHYSEMLVSAGMAASLTYIYFN
jgi:surface antigen